MRSSKIVLRQMQRVAHCGLTLLLALLLWIPATSSSAELIGTVIGISDGDTVTLLDAEKHQYKIRLVGIDAPEKNQAFGQASKQSLSDLVYRKQITVNWDKQDRYGRILGTLFSDHVDINLEQIHRGMAWHYKKYQNEQTDKDRIAYATAEDRARANRIGLWRDATPVPPWEFRRRR